MGKLDSYPEDFEDDFEGFTNEDGEENIIDDVSLDEPMESFYRTEMAKVTSSSDKFASIPLDKLDGNTKRRVKRQLNKRLEGIGGAKAKHLNVEEVNGYAVYDLATPPYNLDHLIDLSVENDTHWACISLKARNIVGLGYQWKETSKVKEARARVEDDDERMLKLSRKLQRITDTLDEWVEDLNEEDDITETLLKVWLDVEATGNGYIEVGRNRNGTIGYLGHIPAASMRVRAARDGYVQLIWAGSGAGMMGKNDRPVFFRNFGDFTTKDIFKNDPQPNEVIHIKKHSPKNAYYGVPDVIAAMSAVAGDKFASEYNLDYFENKAVPRYALIVKGAKLSLQAERKILDYFRREVKGKNHGTLYIPVPAHMGSNVDVSLTPIENKVQEASFERYRDGNRLSIAMVHHVPLSKLGAAKSVAGAREDDKGFRTQVVQPEQKRLERKLNRILKEKTDMYRIKLAEYDLVDEETKSRINDREIRTGIVNPNEIRADKGLHPRKGGDQYVSLAAEQESNIKLRDAQAKQAKMRQDIGGGKPGVDQKTSDGSEKNGGAKGTTRTPADQTSRGRGSTGEAIDQGKQKADRR